jgi:dipeptidyl aminopeptidase/acylaminoacyl peptidase
VAFVASRVDIEGNRYRSAVWLAATDGSTAPYPLTSGEHGDGGPAWSPDRGRLAFTRSRDGRHTLNVLPVGGPGEVVVVCERPEAVEDARWSPDGTRIAFASREGTGRYRHGDDDRARPPRHIDRLVGRLAGEGWILDRPRGVFVVPADASGPPVLVAGGDWDYSGFVRSRRRVPRRRADRGVQ